MHFYRTLAWLCRLIGLAMSSRSDDLVSLDSSSPSLSLTVFSCASSSICGVLVPRVVCSSNNIYLSGNGAVTIDWRGVDGGGVGTRGSQVVRGV